MQFVVAGRKGIQYLNDSKGPNPTSQLYKPPTTKATKTGARKIATEIPKPRQAAKLAWPGTAYFDKSTQPYSIPSFLPRLGRSPLLPNPLHSAPTPTPVNSTPLPLPHFIVVSLPTCPPLS